MKNIPKSQKGVVLIEVLIAFLIFVIGITGSLALLMQAARVNTFNITRLTALNIAEDALESIKNIRDTNWLIYSTNLRECWNFSPDTDEDADVDTNDDTCTADANGQNNHAFGVRDKINNERLRTMLVDFDPVSSRRFLLTSPEHLNIAQTAFVPYQGAGDPNGEAINPAAADGRTPRLYLTADGRYTHDDTGNTASIFYRTVDFYYIDSAQSQLLPNDPATKADDNRIRVVATVYWKDDFVNDIDIRSLELETTITDYLDRTDWLD